MFLKRSGQSLCPRTKYPPDKYLGGGDTLKASVFVSVQVTKAASTFRLHKRPDRHVPYIPRQIFPQTAIANCATLPYRHGAVSLAPKTA